MKIIVILALLIIVGSLFSALMKLIKASQGSTGMAKSLTLRIGLSVLLFVLLMVAFYMGWITPHGI